MNRVAESLTDNVRATMEDYLDDLSGATRQKAVLAAIFSEDELRRIRYAMANMTVNCDDVALSDLGLDEIDPYEHGDEDSGFTDADAEAVLDERMLQLEAEYHRLAALFGGADDSAR